MDRKPQESRTKLAKRTRPYLAKIYQGLSRTDSQHATRSVLTRSSTRRLKTQVWRDTFAKTRANTASQHATC
eukprot:7843038-Pyramimonas_sp.AAC.1